VVDAGGRRRALAAVCLHEIPSSQPLRVTIAPTTSLPLRSGAFGKALLAYELVDAEAVETYVVANGPLIQVRANGPLDVVAAEIQKSPQELAVELAILQQIVSTQAVGSSAARPARPASAAPRCAG